MKINLFKRLKLLLKIFIFICYLFQIGSFPEVQANEILVAVASNFHNPFKAISEKFEQKTEHTVKIISGSTGKLYAQIINGAPFELFLAADSRRPRMLEQAGQAVAKSRFTYALGKITLWSSDLDTLAGDGKLILRNRNFARLAMANPVTAPYGKAALQTIKNLGLLERLQPLIVQGENIGQTFQFVHSQNVKLGFVALSQVLDPRNNKKGSRWDIPDEFYDPIEQDTVILKKGKHNSGVIALWKFLKNESSKQIIQKYGYALP